ncbi:MAG: hypothetical protein N3E50_00110 [Candidatus Goldbacteria bacterium]|nr:hypothetical protein [Candidatus Goldiibacteriota bacterium]
MAKKFILIIVFIFLFIIPIISENYDLNDLSMLMSKHIENIKKITELEKKLVSYKFSSGNEFLNIINRKNIEKNIHKRNQILKEINNLTIENQKIIEKLFNVYDLLYNDIKNKYLDKDFITIIDYIDTLKFDIFIKSIYLDKNDIIRLQKQGKIDLLKAKYESQNIIINEINNFIIKQKIKANLFKNTDKNKEILKNIEILYKKLTDFNNSQQIIKLYI